MFSNVPPQAFKNCTYLLDKCKPSVAEFLDDYRTRIKQRIMVLLARKWLNAIYEAGGAGDLVWEGEDGELNGLTMGWMLETGPELEIWRRIVGFM